MLAFPDNPTSHLGVLKHSTDLQSELLKLLVKAVAYCREGRLGQVDAACPLSPDVRQDMLNAVLHKVQELIHSDSCSIYIKDSESRATMRAALGYQADDVDQASCAVVSADSVENDPGKAERLGLTGWVISTGRSFLAGSPRDVVTHPHWRGDYERHHNQEPQETAGALAAFLAIPLRDWRGHVIGALKVERKGSRESFSVENQITLEALGQVAGRCISYVADAQNSPAGAAITSWALRILSDAVSTEGELDTYLDIAVRVVASATLADACSVFRIDESNSTLTQRAGCGHQGLKNVIRSYRLPERAQLANCAAFDQCTPKACAARHIPPLPEAKRVGITAWVAGTGKSFYAESKQELREHCHHLGKFDAQNFKPESGVNSGTAPEEECSTWLGIPLTVGGTTIGVLKIENKTPKGVADHRYFPREVRQRLDVLAQDIALSVRRLEIQSQTRYDVINKAMPTILTILQGELDVRHLVERVVDKTAGLFDARACALFLKEGDKLIQPEWAAYGYAAQPDKATGRYKIREYDLVRPDDILDTPPPDKKVGLTVWIAVKRLKFSARSNEELKLHPHHKGFYDDENFREGEQCESFMGVPLLVGEQDKKELIGVLKVETKQRKVDGRTDYSYFNEQDALVFELMANSAAIAIQNARLLASRRLADRLVAQPNRYSTLSEVFRFINDQVDVVNTVEGAARHVTESDMRKAEIIERIAAVLRPDFNDDLLEQFATLIRDSKDRNNIALTGLLRLMVNMMRVKRWDEIADIDTTGFQTPPLYNREFVLYQCTQTLLNTHREVSEHLRRYNREPSHTVELVDCLRTLSTAQEAAEKMNLFERNVLSRIFGRWKELIQGEYDAYHPIPMLYQPGQPLQANSSVFFGREDILGWLEDSLRDRKAALVLHGGWHTGKTSILLQVEAGKRGEKLRDRNAVFPVFVDLQAVTGTGNAAFLSSLAGSIASALRRRGWTAPSAADDLLASKPSETFDYFLESVVTTIQQHGLRQLVLMIDEIEKLEERVQRDKLDTSMVDYLRSKMQLQTGVSFILAGRQRPDEAVSEHLRALFNVAEHREVGFLNEVEARRLITEPAAQYAVTYDDACVDRTLKLTAGHPHFIQQLCSNCLVLLNNNAKDYRVTPAVLDEALAAALQHNYTLDSMWKTELSEDDRTILATMAQTISAADGEVPGEELLRQGTLDRERLNASLGKPVMRKLVVSCAEADGAIAYRFGVDMLRLWLRRP